MAFVRAGKGKRLINKNFLIENTIGFHEIKVKNKKEIAEVFQTENGAFITIYKYSLSKYINKIQIFFNYLKEL